MRSYASFMFVTAGLFVMAFTLAGGCARRESRGLASAAPGTAARLQFTDVTEQLGIRFRHTSGASGRLYLPETMGAGCAFFDYDGDGWQDIFLLNSSRLPGYSGRGPFYPALYRNLGGTAFQDVTREAGLAFECYGMGCAAGDYDGDGDDDLFVTALDGNRLLRNGRVPGGQSRFRDVTREAGLARRSFSTSCAWFDSDRDGNLDLFVCNYARWRPEINQICQSPVGPYMCSPSRYQGEPSTLYRNNGDGTFTDVTRKAGVASRAGKSLGVVVWDYDRDGWPDLAVANDIEPNQLFRNNHDGTFRDVGVESGMAYNSEGKARGGMGIDTADPAGDGREVILIGNNSKEGLAFFREDGQGGFADDASPAGVLDPSLPFLVFGALFCDVDLDGFPDILTANGHVNPHVDRLGTGITFAQRLALYRNTGRSSGAQPAYVEIGATLGPALATRRVWRGLSWADYDNDGDPDFLVTACNGRPMLLRNDLIPTADRSRAQSPEPRAQSASEGSSPHWLKIQLIGTKSNRSGLGSRVTVEAGGRRQTGWVRSGSSYCSSSEQKALFGLGDTTRVDRVVVRWASGGEEELREVPVDRLLVIREGTGRVR